MATKKATSGKEGLARWTAAKPTPETRAGLAQQTDMTADVMSSRRGLPLSALVFGSAYAIFGWLDYLHVREKNLRGRKHEILLRAMGRGEPGRISLERAQGNGGESPRITCAGTALNSKSESK